MTNSHKNIINPFLERSTLLIMTFPKTVESKDLLWGRTCAVDNVRARRKGVLGKLYEIQISPERGLRGNSLKFPSYFGMEYVRPWNMGKKLLEYLISQTPSSYNYCKTSAAHLASVIFCFGPFVVLHMLHQSAVVWGAGHICRKLQWRLVDLHFQNPATCKSAIAM